MKHFWQIKNKEEDLLVFFHGWGMDHRPLQFLKSDRFDVLVFYDYRNLSLSEDVLATLPPYRSIYLVAWSMGVWASQQLVQHFPEAPAFSLAINGTLNPIHDRYGIPEATYNQTLHHFSENAPKTFYQSMFSDPDEYDRFLETQPDRTWQDQQAELSSIKTGVQSDPIQHQVTGRFDESIVSNQDKIITARNQLRYWKNQCDYRVIDAGHYPFYQWEKWEDMFREVESE